LKFKSPYDILLEKFNSNPELFKDNPYHKLRGVNIYWSKIENKLCLKGDKNFESGIIKTVN